LTQKAWVCHHSFTTKFEETMMTIKQHSAPRLRFRNARPIIRSVGVVSASLALCAGVTYAALQSQKSTLTNNTIQSATANLQISKDGATFDDTLNGFTFANVEPGGPAMPINGNMIWLRNMGSIPLGVHLAIDSTGLVNIAQLDLSKIMVVVTPVSGSGTLGTPQSTTMAALTASAATGGTDLNFSVPINSAAQYKLQVSMSEGAYTGVAGGSAALTGVSFVFTGISASHQS
jgi:hypothetical protein